MPNRILKESICTSDSIDQLSSFCENFFYRLIVNCDDYGRMDARPKVLAAKLYPLKDIRTEHIEKALQALASAELVTLYEVDGKPYLQMRTWSAHQTIRAKKSKYPSPDGESGQTKTPANICKQMHADENKCPRNPIQSNPNRNRNSDGGDDDDLTALGDQLNAVFDAAKGIGLTGEASLEKANLLVADYTAEWVLEAIRRASCAPKEAWCWRYIEGILRRWKDAGGMDDESKPQQLQQPKKTRVEKYWTVINGEFVEAERVVEV